MAKADPLKRRDGGDTPLHHACYMDREKQALVVHVLLKLPVDPNLTNEAGETPLWIASMMGHPNVIEKLCKAGADINRSREDGKTPLIAATQAGEVENLQLLLDQGADPEFKDKEGRTALEWALKEESTRCVAILRKR